MKGYMRKILNIDTGSGGVTVQPTTEELARCYIGGSGLGAKLLYDEPVADEDPLGAENPLIFAVGPLTGTRIYNSNRFEVVGRSPLTGIYGEANCGGYWGESLKRSGFDALVLRGRAARPSLVLIQDGKASIEDARDLWGKDTFVVDSLLKERYGEEAQIACIGVAGENQVRFANITTDGKHARAIGRCGFGALMGSKNIKAVVIRGNREVEQAHPDKIKELIKKLGPTMGEFRKSLGAYGTSGGVELCEEIGNLPVKNWYQGPYREGARKISGQHMAETILTDRYHCGRCVLSCGRVVKAVGGPYDGQEIGGPEYETIGLLGSNLLVDDLPSIAKANELCNRLGMDTISAGGVIGFAMEAYQHGLIAKHDTGGIDLRWGNAEAVFEILEQIALRRGLGDRLAEGVRRAAEGMGGRAVEFALEVKGLEPPAHDPRAKVSVALGYATSNRGACHLQGFTHDFEDGAFIADLGTPQLTDRFTTEGKAENVVVMQNLMSMFDSLTCCKFVLFGGMTVQPLVDFLNFVTGWEFSREEFMQTGERIFTLKRLYNVRKGISRKDDTLPRRFLTHRRGGGTNEVPHLGRMLGEYYDLRGWDEFGIPTTDRLERLGIEMRE
jgi:aldehyde:ferredoxin oxidoreductase